MLKSCSSLQKLTLRWSIPHALSAVEEPYLSFPSSMADGFRVMDCIDRFSAFWFHVTLPPHVCPRIQLTRKLSETIYHSTVERFFACRLSFPIRGLTISQPRGPKTEEFEENRDFKADTHARL
jgi:hypothetical protein